MIDLITQLLLGEYQQNKEQMNLIKILGDGTIMALAYTLDGMFYRGNQLYVAPSVMVYLNDPKCVRMVITMLKTAYRLTEGDEEEDD